LLFVKKNFSFFFSPSQSVVRGELEAAASSFDNQAHNKNKTHVMKCIYSQFVFFRFLFVCMNPVLNSNNMQNLLLLALLGLLKKTLLVVATRTRGPLMVAYERFLLPPRRRLLTVFSFSCASQYSTNVGMAMLST